MKQTNSPPRSDDQRIRRTHQLLLQALTELMSEKNFADIRVTDICERAGVHRSTFYAHFEDKSHLLLFGLQSLMEELVHSYGDRSFPAFHRSVYRNLKYFQRNRQEYTRQLLDPLNSQVRQTIEAEYTRALRTYLRELHPTIPVRELEITSVFFTGGFFSLVMQWLAEQPERSAHEVADEISPLIFRSFLPYNPKP